MHNTIALLSLTVGLLIGNYFNKPVAANNSTQGINNTNTSQNQTNSSVNYISADEAISIAIKAIDPGPDIRFEAVFVDGSRPYWQVTGYDTRLNSSTYGKSLGGAKIDAITGEVIGCPGAIE
jgi:hypothetical protein